MYCHGSLCARRWSEELYGHVNGLRPARRIWCAMSPMSRDSIVEAVEKGYMRSSNGKLKLFASDVPVPTHTDHSSMVLLLPALQFTDGATPANTPELMTNFANPSTSLYPVPKPTSHLLILEDRPINLPSPEHPSERRSLCRCLRHSQRTKCLDIRRESLEWRH